MKINKISLMLLIALFTTFTTSSFAQDRKMKYDDYKVELEKWTKIKADKDVEIKKIDDEIAGLKARLGESNGKISSTWNEIYSLTNSSPEKYAAYKAELDGLIDALNGMLSLDNDELFARKGELETLRAKFDALKNDPQSLIFQSKGKITEAESLINRIDTKIRGIKPSTYTVAKGDNLWRIAGKKEVFDNPFKWVSIYSVNQDQIKNPDLIFPDQKFSLPNFLSKDQVTVNRGENLKKIAQRVYGNASDWTKIYDANRKLIDRMNSYFDEKAGATASGTETTTTTGNKLYPEMILNIAK
ncbi:LysM peptidoglycan-binding domain-containing protein [bacterium]|nr:LysM peptidoglycan-binding domain-containing protein [bacterium]